MFRCIPLAIAAVGILTTPTASLVLAQKPAATTRPKEARKDPDFVAQGEYSGTLPLDQPLKLGLQLVALGKGQFRATTYLGGLPGDGWNGETPSVAEAARRDNGSVFIDGRSGDGILKGGVITVIADGREIGQLKKVTRKSKTINAKPPQGATVLFDGTSIEHWHDALLKGKLLAFDPHGKGATSKPAFGSHTIHIEFRLPYMPAARGQGRGNSGLYLQSRYEVQMLDSFGLEGKDNECGGIYKIAAPKVNMCYPPLAWQTYDVDFTAAKYSDSGKLLKHPRMTVKHNGVTIHENLELPHSTTAAPRTPGPEDGPVYLQNHGNPVRYRNVWVVPKAADSE